MNPVLIIHSIWRSHLIRQNLIVNESFEKCNLSYNIWVVALSSALKLSMHLNVDPSFLSRRYKLSFFKAQHILTWRKILRSHTAQSFPRVGRDNLLKFPRTALHLVIKTVSQPLPEKIILTRSQNLWTPLIFTPSTMMHLDNFSSRRGLFKDKFDDSIHKKLNLHKYFPSKHHNEFLLL